MIGWRNSRPSARTLLVLMAGGIAVATGCDSAPVNEVVVYVAVDRGNAEPILADFESRTGIRVRALYDAESAKTTGLVQRILAESNRPVCDLFWNNEVVQTMMLAERGLLESYHSPVAADIDQRWRDPKGRWTGQATRSRVIVYNSRWIPAEQAPRCLRDLTDRRRNGRVAIANPQFGSTRTHIAALFALWGAEPAQTFLQQLLDNNARVVDGNAMVKNLVSQAPSKDSIVIGITDSDDVASGQTAGEPISCVYPDQAQEGTLVFPTTVSLLRHAPHPGQARRLADYLLSIETVQRFAHDDSGYAPVPRRNQGTSADQPRAMAISFQQIHSQLATSSRWTAEHVHP
jgi:iron(III) transport system substrate-binding protein